MVFEDSAAPRLHLEALPSAGTPLAYGTTVAHERGDCDCAFGWACLAINGALPQEPDRTHVRLKMFLDGKPYPGVAG